MDIFFIAMVSTHIAGVIFLLVEKENTELLWCLSSMVWMVLSFLK